MNKSRMLEIATLVGILLINPVQSIAHVALAQSEPVAGSTLNAGPENLVLGFTEAVRLLKVSVSGKVGKEIDIGFKPMAMEHEKFTLPLPVLATGEYRVNWTVMGKDGHRMEASFDFALDPAASPASAPMHQEHGDGHGDHAAGHAASSDASANHGAHGGADH